MSNQGTAPSTKIFLILTGILIPVIAAILPPVVEYYKPTNGLVFTYKGPIEIDKTYAFSIQIKNSGKELEKNVEILIPKDISKENLQIESKSKFTIKNENSKTIINIGDIRIDQLVILSFLISDKYFYILDSQLENLDIMSETHVAKYDGPSEEWDIIFKTGFFGFILTLALLFIYAIYYEYFMDKAKKEKYLLEQIEKL